VSVLIVAAWIMILAAILIRARVSRTSLHPMVMVVGTVIVLSSAGLLWTNVRTPSLLPDSAPPRLTEAEAMNIFTPLHANIYRAFDYTREGDIYDALARSVDGPMLDSVYNDVYRGLVMQEEGGAVARVRKVSVLETALLDARQDSHGPSDGFRVRARWRVEGVVYHWGHSHTRENEYSAEYAVGARSEGWRIVDAVPLEQRRIQTPEQAASQATAEPPQTPAQSDPQHKAQPWRPNR
jgi:hypothetical protein